MYVYMHVRIYARAFMYACIYACKCVCAYLYLGQWRTVTRLFQHLENKTHVSETKMHTRSRGFSLSLPLPFSLCHFPSLPFRSPCDPICARSVPLFFKRVAVPSYQRWPSSPRKREGNVRFPTNLHGVRRSARPTSRWAPKAHRMMEKTQQWHCERSFGTNVLVLGKQRDNLLSPSNLL